MASKRILYFDLETTGLDFKTSKIVSVFMKLVQGNKILGMVKSYVNPMEPITNDHIHGITDEMVAKAPTIEALSPVILEMFANAHLVVGYNILRYDLPLLSYELKRGQVNPVNCFIQETNPSMKIFDLYYYIKSNKLFENLEDKKLSTIYNNVMSKKLLCAHQAEADVNACIDIMNKLRISKPIMIEKSVDTKSILDYQLSLNDTIHVTFGKFLGSVMKISDFDASYVQFLKDKKFLNISS